MPSLVKEIMMKEMSREFEASPYAFISSFQGLPVSDLSDFRRAIEKVAKAKGYKMVLDGSGGLLLYSEPADDIFSAVKAELGIK